MRCYWKFIQRFSQIFNSFSNNLILCFFCLFVVLFFYGLLLYYPVCVFSILNNTKDLDLSSKTDLDFWDCSEKEKLPFYDRIW